MSWRLLYHPDVEKFLEKQDKTVRIMLEMKLRKLRDNPTRHLDSFVGPYHKFRAGDYRALLDVDFSNRIIRVRHLNHRSKVYKR